MEASSFDEANAVYGKPEGMSADECNPLSVMRGHVGNLPCLVSCWKPTQAEMDEIQRTGRVWLVIVGYMLPPLYLAGHKPEMSQAVTA